jgi:trans-aconitate methyltransferase
VPTMSRVEQVFCRSAPWRAFTRAAVLPWAMQGLRPEGHTLEIGGGSGAMAAAIAEAHPSAQLTVTDYDPSMVDAARRRLQPYRSVDVRQADATDLPFDEASFDVIASFIMLHHVGAWEQAIGRRCASCARAGHWSARACSDLLATRPMDRLHHAERAQHRMLRSRSEHSTVIRWRALRRMTTASSCERVASPTYSGRPGKRARGRGGRCCRN